MEPTAPRFHLNDVVEACVDYERPPQPGINFHASVDPQRWLARQTRRRLSDRVSALPTAVHLVFDELELLIWPSVWPLDHGRAMAAQTAALSLVTPLANDATSGASPLNPQQRDWLASLKITDDRAVRCQQRAR